MTAPYESPTPHKDGAGKVRRRLHVLPGGSVAQRRPERVLVAPDLAEPARPHRGSTLLRRLLVELDALALIASWAPLFWTSSPAGATRSLSVSAKLIVVASTTLICLALAALWRLYQARVCNVRRTERALLFRLAVCSAIVGAVLLSLFGDRPSDSRLIGVGALAFLLLVIERAAYRAWLNAERRRGRYSRSTLVVGTNDEAVRWCRLLGEYPELGIAVRGVVGEKNDEVVSAGLRWLGTTDQLAQIADAERATSILLVVTAFAPSVLNKVVRETLRAGLHVEMSTGLQGIAGDRLRWTPASRESLVYLEHRTLSKGAMVVKRVFDIVVASIALLVAVPIMVVAAIFIRRHDGGPILFRQQRVGRGGKLFTLCKLRTMTPNAEAIKRDLVAQNFRGGPLFKIYDDPRVTPIGRFLRRSSIDELPQLYNILQGHMSLVGPRPALPEEVEHFADELLTRHTVLPGITGLWQLDARDHESFDSYQRLDIHYVENWSIWLDITILTGTAISLLRRLIEKEKPSCNS